jgi:tRNA G18 (ribose-2'-O)-methylase SpoU
LPDFKLVEDPLDPRIEAYRDVRERDLVGRRGLFLAEGEVVLRHLVAAERHCPVSVLIDSRRRAKLAPLLAELPDDIPIFHGPQAVLDATTGFPIHRGILALGRALPSPGPGELLAGLGRVASVLVLYAIANHDNLGGIFRNAAAFGADAVLLDPACCDPLYRKALRVSVGAVLRVPFARLQPGEDALALLAAQGFASLALTPGGSVDLADVMPADRVAVLLGPEGPGLAPEVIARAVPVRIRMAPGFDSLNVATTSGIVLHRLANRRAARNEGV